MGLSNGSKQIEFGATGTMAFTDCYKHMECLGGMGLQSFLTNGHFIYPCNAGYPS